MLDTEGVHIIAELSGCDVNKLSNLEGVREALLESARRANSQVIDVVMHKFSPLGISGVALIAESHISVHTWPEYGYAAIDIYTCGSSCWPALGCDYLASFFEAKSVQTMSVRRGLNNQGVFSHQIGADQGCSDVPVAIDNPIPSAGR